MAKLVEMGEKKEKAWEEKLEAYKKEYPELAKELENWIDLKLPMDYLNSEEFLQFDKNYSTREASGVVINRLAERIPNLMGGSADLAPSNKTNMDNREVFSHENYKGSNIHFGVREHAMAGILNGMALHGGLRVYGGTFFVFSDYMKHSMRLSALMKKPVTYVLTHDSIGVGEDGPTHQPVEHLAMLRSMPNMTTFRPADAKETAVGWYYALNKEDGPTSLVLTRQGLPILDETSRDALKGAYVLKDTGDNIDIILMATGSEVQLIYKAADILKEKGINSRVVSMPSWELFEAQSEEYKESVLPKNIRKRLAVEAASPLGWHKYIGLDGEIISMDGFGASAPGNQLFEKFGFTVENVVEKVLELIK